MNKPIDDDDLETCEGCGGGYLPDDMSDEWPELCLDCAEKLDDPDG